MRIVIAGGGLVGLALAGLLRARGAAATVVERRPAGVTVRRGFMLGHQGYDAVRELGLMDVLAREGRPIGVAPDGASAATAIDMGRLLGLLEGDADIRFGASVADLLRDAGGRVRGVAVSGVHGHEEIACDLVVACDGARSRVREMAGLEARTTPLEEAQVEWMSPLPSPETFAMRYLGDGGHIGMLSWREGTFGWRTLRRVGAAAAVAPGLAAMAEMWERLLPEAGEAARAIASPEDVRYLEPFLLSCPRWWAPGVVLIGEAAHVFGPETGASAGIGLADAHALAVAVERGGTPDAVCATYEAWRSPAARTLEMTDPSRLRLRGAILPPPAPGEEWPPGEGG